MAHILVVDDDRNICELLRLYLENDGHQVDFAHEGSSGLTRFREIRPDLVVLDLMLPLINGFEVCRMMRRESPVPILMLTARDSAEDKISGLDTGADDYVVKPFDPREVAARVRALLRRRSGESEPVREGKLVKLPGLKIDMIRYEVWHQGKRVEMKPKELQLLHCLAGNPGRVFSREDLLDRVWGYEFPGGTRTVDVHIKRIREKIEAADNPWQIKTVWGVGYKFEVLE